MVSGTLGDVALEQGDFTLARRCFKEARDLSALFLVQTACGDAEELQTTAKMASDTGVANIAVMCYLLQGEVQMALQVLVKANRLPEAAFFARTYCPSELSSVVKLWKEDLAKVNQAVSDSLADPATYPDLFPDFELTIAAEKAFEARRTSCPPLASQYAAEKEWLEMDVLEEIKRLTPEGFKQMLLRGPEGAAVTPDGAGAGPPAQPVVSQPHQRLWYPHPRQAQSLPLRRQHQRWNRHQRRFHQHLNLARVVAPQISSE